MRSVLLPTQTGLALVGIALAGVASCGRIGFDLLPGEGAADSGPSTDASLDGVVTPQESGTSRETGAHEDGPAGPPPIVIDTDVILDGGKSLDFGTGDGGACRIVSNGSTIRATAGWTGHVWIKNCLVQGLGTIVKPAISVDASGSAFVTIEGSTFESSGAIEIVNRGASTTTFQNNTIVESSVVALDPNAENSTPAFSASGDGTGAKVFRGNHIYRSSASFQSPSWIIGGDTDADANLVIGLRASFVLGARGLVVRGNYVHNFRFVGAQDESAIRVLPGATDLLTEHNVLRRGNWVVRGLAGEFRYNAVLDTASDSWVQDPSDGTKIHHDVFLMCAAPGVDVIAGIDAGSASASGLEIYANTFDGGGSLMRMKGPVVAVGPSATLDSFRSNIVFRFPFTQSTGRAALRGALAEADDPPPARLGYADYNLFFNPEANAGGDAGASLVNYALAVSGRRARLDPGFALNDVHPAGPVNEQVDPQLAGTTDTCFPWSDSDIIASRVTVSQMLAGYRAVYAPRAGSPVIGNGDPADGADAAIGAVGNGTLDVDRFGRRP